MSDWRRWLPQDQTDWLLIVIAVISGVLLIAANQRLVSRNAAYQTE